MENLTVVSTIFLAFHCTQSIRCFNSFLKWEHEPLCQAISPLFQFFCQMENVSVVSRVFWPCIVGHLTVASNLLSNGKSSYCFNNFFLCIQGNLSVVSTTFWLLIAGNLSAVSIVFTNGKSHRWISNAGNLSLVSILLSNGKSNRCFNNFLAFNCKQSIPCFNSFVKWKN